MQLGNFGKWTDAAKLIIAILLTAAIGFVLAASIVLFWVTGGLGGIEIFGFTLTVRFMVLAAYFYILYRIVKALVKWFFEKWIEEIPVGFQGYTTFYGIVIMERDTMEGRQGNGPIIMPPWKSRIRLLPSGEIQIRAQVPEKDRSNPDPHAERPYLERAGVKIQGHDLSIIDVYDTQFRFNFANYDTGILVIESIIDEEEQEQIRIKEKELQESTGDPNRKLTADEKKAAGFDDAEKERRRKKYKALFPKTDPYNNTIAVDTRIVIRFQILSPVQFDRKVGSLETLSINLASITQSVLQDKAGRYTFGMAVYFKNQFQDEMRRKIEAEILDPDCDEFKFAISLGKNDPRRAVILAKWWGGNVEDVAIPNWGVPYSVNIGSAAAVSAGFYLNERTTKGEADANYGKKVAEILGVQEIERAKGAEKAAEIAETEAGQFALDLQKQIEIAKAFGPPKDVRVYSTGGGITGQMTAGVAGGFEYFANDSTVRPQPRSDDDRRKKGKGRRGGQEPQTGAQDQGGGGSQQEPAPPAPNQPAATRRGASPEPPQRGSSDAPNYSVE